MTAKYIWRKKSDGKEKNPVWADRNRNQFVYEWLHGTDAEGEADVSDKEEKESIKDLIMCRKIILPSRQERWMCSLQRYKAG